MGTGPGGRAAGPPLPGKVACDQAKKLTGAFPESQPRKAAVATTLFNDKIQQPGR